MFITTYKVTAPQVIEEFVDTLEYDNKSVLVHVDYLAICKADIRYYLGNRDINVLNHKYPLAPKSLFEQRKLVHPLHLFLSTKFGIKITLSFFLNVLVGSFITCPTASWIGANGYSWIR